MPQEEFSATFRKSPMKRAKLRGLKRNAAVVLGNVGTADDADVLECALDDPEPVVREHAAWALARLTPAGSARPVRANEGTAQAPPYERNEAPDVSCGDRNRDASGQSV